MSLPNSVPEENPYAKRGRKTLIETEKEAVYPQRNGLQVVKAYEIFNHLEAVSETVIKK